MSRRFLKKMNGKSSFMGGVCGLTAGILWGVSGVFGQFLFETRNIEVSWLVPVRLTTSGILMLIYLFCTNRGEMHRLCKNRRDFFQTIFAGTCGTMVFQVAFFGAVQRSNAGTATVLQYLCPVFVMTYSCTRKREKPKKPEIAAVILALGGIFLVSTHGNVQALVITPEALAWGVGCAFCMFLNTVIPESLYEKYSSTTIVGWALFFGGIVLSCLFRPWRYKVDWDLAVLVSLFFIIIGGSVMAYLLYACSIHYSGPTKASLFACIEAVTATIFSAVWLKTSFVMIDLVGFVLILSTVFVLNKKEKGEY